MAMIRSRPVAGASTVARWSAILGAVTIAVSGCTSSSGPGSTASSGPSSGAGSSAATSAGSSGGVSASAASSNPAPGSPSGGTSSSPGEQTQSSTPSRGSTGTPTSINGGPHTGGSGAHPSGTAVTAYQAWTADWNAGRYRDMWSALPSDQQGQVSASAFAACEKDQAQQVGATAIVYRRTVRQRATVAATPSDAHTAGVAITAAIYFDARDPVTRTLTLFWYADGRDWRWLLDDASLRAYRRGSCPA